MTKNTSWREFTFLLLTPLIVGTILIFGENPASGAVFEKKTEADRLAVLVYHHIEDPLTSDVSCTPRAFETQMEALHAAGFTPLDLEKTRRFLAGALPGVKKPLLITFDDGYESVFTYALPVARRLQMPMTVFMVTARAGLKPQFSRYLSAGQIREMSDSGWFSFGSHTDDLHVDVISIRKAFRREPNPVLDLVRADLETSKRALELITGRPIFALAWPYGKHDGDTRRIARECGFVLQFTSRSGYDEPGSDPYEIKRIPVSARDSVASVLKKADGR
ncbi:MAG: polysaccharide deacetylase family protein [Candidatus Ozemobacteraceae bacterium]